MLAHVVENAANEPVFLPGRSFGRGLFLVSAAIMPIFAGANREGLCFRG
jgi:hypothetical protein